MPLGTTLRDEWIGAERDYQIPIAKYLNDVSECPRKFVGIQTGKGKTYVSMSAVATYGKILAVVIRPMFIHKWVEDIQKYLKVSQMKLWLYKVIAILKCAY